MHTHSFPLVGGFLGIVLLLFLTLFESVSFFAGVGGTIGILFGITFFFSPFFAFLTLLFIRPLLDRVGEFFTIPAGNIIALPITALLGVFPILFAIFLFLARKKNLSSREMLPLIFSIVLFLGIVLTSVLISKDPATSIRECIRVLSIFCVFFLGYALVLEKESKKRFHTLIATLLFSIVIPGVFGIAQFLFGSGLEGTLSAGNRIFGTFAHPNQFAGFLVIAFALAFFLFSEKKSTPQKNIYLAFMGIILLLLILTYARGALIALVLFVFFVSIKKSLKYFLAMLGVLLLLFFFVPTFQDRVEEIYNPPVDSSIYWRIDQWQRMYLLFLNRPLLGHGAGTEIIVHQNEYGESAGAPEAHNDFLKIAVENGVIGLLSFTSIYLALFWALWQSHQRNDYPEKRNVLFITGSLAMALFLYFFVDNVWPSTALMWSLWAFLGGVLAYTSTPLSSPPRQKSNPAQ